MDRPFSGNSPESRELHAASVAFEIDLEMRREPGGVTAYMNKLARQYQRLKAHDMVTTVAEAIEPVDSVLGVNMKAPHKNAFYQGGLLGLRAAKPLLGKDFSDAVAEVNIPMSEALFNKDIDQFSKYHLMAQSLLNIGEKGYSSEVNKPYVALLEKWEDVLCKDVRYQAYLKTGFGFVIHQAEIALHQKDMQEMQQEIDGGIDIDSELAWLLGADRYDQ